MGLHFEEGLDLADCEVFPVAKGDQLVKGAEQLVGILQDFSLVQTLACAGDDLGKQMQGVNVLQDVGLPVRDEDHVKLVKGLVDKSDVVLLDGGVLGTAVGELGERRQQGFDSRSGHLAELPREDSFTAARADGGGENNLTNPC